MGIKFPSDVYLNPNEISTASNIPNTIVQRDSSGNFSAGTITATLSGSASNATLLKNMSVTSSAVSNTVVQRDANGNFSANNITAQYFIGKVSPAATSATILHLDDAQFSTTATTATLEKTFRFVQSSTNPVSSLNVYVSAWNASSGATTTIAVNIDGGTNSTVQTSSTTETLLSITNLTVPSTNGIHTFNLSLNTSNVNYSAYTQLLEVYQS